MSLAAMQGGADVDFFSVRQAFRDGLSEPLPHHNMSREEIEHRVALGLRT